VVLTSNNSRDLSAALKRRCLHLFLDYPDAGRELEILRSKHTGLPEAAARQLIAVVRGLRELQLRKSPSISETIDWARTLSVLGVAEVDATVLAETANVVLKYERDLHRALDVLPGLVDPNRELPDLRHSHGHDHANGHGHAHTHQHQARDAATSDEAAEGRAVRADMDRPGRHDVGYYGAPTAGPQRPAAPRDGRDRGARSFAALTRRRPG
jgi:MoxR-like ATPase